MLSSQDSEPNLYSGELGAITKEWLDMLTLDGGRTIAVEQPTQLLTSVACPQLYSLRLRLLAAISVFMVMLAMWMLIEF